jgi:hypothetical protein
MLPRALSFLYYRIHKNAWSRAKDYKQRHLQGISTYEMGLYRKCVMRKLQDEMWNEVIREEAEVGITVNHRTDEKSVTLTT